MIPLKEPATYIENTLKNIFTALWQAARAGMDGWDSTLMPA